MKAIQYTIRDIPPELDRALRDRVRAEGSSLNSVLRKTLMRGIDMGDEAVVNHDFDDLAGKWVRDEACEEVLEDMRSSIDEELWR